MPEKATVAVLKTSPEIVLGDIEKLMKMAGVENVLPKENTTIIKENISWHFPYLSANTTPWQLEGVISTLKNSGYRDVVAVHNNTVVTDIYKGEALNRLASIYRKYKVEERYNFTPEISNG